MVESFFLVGYLTRWRRPFILRKERKRLSKPKLKTARRLTKRFEILDHTADIGVIVYGENLRPFSRTRAKPSSISSLI